MDSKRLVIGSLVGGITMWALGYLVFNLALGDFYATQVGMPGVERENPLLWPDVLGTFALAVLVTLCIGWSGANSLVEGLKIGAIVGFLVWFGVDFIFYGFSNLQTLTRTIIDPFAEIVRTGLTGAVIGAVLAKVGGGGD